MKTQKDNMSGSSDNKPAGRNSLRLPQGICCKETHGSRGNRNHTEIWHRVGLRLTEDGMHLIY